MHAHGREAAGGLVYERHRPEDTRLYRLGEQHYPAVVEQPAQQGMALPAYAVPYNHLTPPTRDLG